MTTERKYEPSFIDAIYLLILISLVPMLWLQCRTLWNRPHLQFFPMAWAAFAYFCYDNSPSVSTTPHWKRQLCGVGVLLVSLVGAAAATFISSPWLSYVAAIGVVTSWMLLRLGRLHWINCLGLTSLLWITVALPSGNDERLIQRLQAISSFGASNFLDAVWIPHLREGNILQLTDKRLFVDEACSGVDSLYALMAISLTIVLWFRQPLIVAACALAMVPVWACCSNLIRLLSIVLAQVWFKVDLATGTPHTILGLFTFVIAFMCDFAFICFLGALFEKVKERPATSTEPRPWLHSRAPSPNATLPPTPAPISLKTWGTLGTLVLLVGFVGVGLYSTKVWARGTTLSYPEFTEPSIASLKENIKLPSQLGPWSLTQQNVTERERGNVMGQFSHAFSYQTPKGNGAISIDYPFRGFHLLDECYEGAGWSATNAREVQDYDPKHGQFQSLGPLQIHKLEFKKDTGEYLFVAFTLFQVDGTPVRSKAMFRGMERFERSVLDPVTYQVQAIYLASEPLTAEQKAEAVENLKTSIEIVRPAFVGIESKP